MQGLIQIFCNLNDSEIWRIFVIAIGILGLYISIIMIVANKFRSQMNTLLGIFTACLSFVLLDLVTNKISSTILTLIMHSTGTASVFLIGPIFYFLLLPARINVLKPKFYIHFLPGILAIIYAIIIRNNVSVSLYLPGFIHATIYLFIGNLSLAKNVFADDAVKAKERCRGYRWKITFFSIVFISFLGICIARITLVPSLFRLINSLVLALLILLIWIRLIYTSLKRRSVY